MKWLASALLTIVIGLSLPQSTSALDDVAQAYAHVKPALVKVWAFDATGIPTDSGTGFVVQSDASQSWIVTATHVVDGARTVKIDINRDLYDLPASVIAATVKRDDITLLLIHRGGLSPVQFASRNQSMVEGKYVATAGYFQNDEQIGSTGQAPRLVGPGTVASLPENGSFIGINIGVEEGLSGAPVFDSNTGEVVGVVDVRSAIGSGGYAVSAPLIVMGFLSQNRVAVGGPTAPVTIAQISQAPSPTPSPTPTPSPSPSPTPVPTRTPTPTPSPTPTRTPAPTPSPSPTRTPSPTPTRTPTPSPSPAPTPSPTPTPRPTPSPKPTPTPTPKPTPSPAPTPSPTRTPSPLPTRVIVQAVPTPPSTVSAEPRPKANQRDVDACFGRVGVSNDRLVAACTSLIALAAPNAFLYDRRCVAYYRAKKADQAIADCTEALRINPDDSSAYNYRAGGYNEKKLYVLALADANKALKLNPNNAGAYIARGFAYERQDVLSARQLALDDYNEAVALDPNMSFFISTLTHMPFNRIPLPPTGGFKPAGYRLISARLGGLYYRGVCSGGAHVELYNDYTVPMFFDVFNEPVREQKDADPANWTKFGHFRLDAGETKALSFANCVRGTVDGWHFWVKNIRFQVDDGPVIFPSTDLTS